MSQFLTACKWIYLLQTWHMYTHIKTYTSTSKDVWADTACSTTWLNLRLIFFIRTEHLWSCFSQLLSFIPLGIRWFSVWFLRNAAFLIIIIILIYSDYFLQYCCQVQPRTLQSECRISSNCSEKWSTASPSQNLALTCCISPQKQSGRFPKEEAMTVHILTFQTLKVQQRSLCHCLSFSISLYTLKNNFSLFLPSFPLCSVITNTVTEFAYLIYSLVLLWIWDVWQYFLCNSSWPTITH